MVVVVVVLFTKHPRVGPREALSTCVVILKTPTSSFTGLEFLFKPNKKAVLRVWNVS